MNNDQGHQREPTAADDQLLYLLRWLSLADSLLD